MNDSTGLSTIQYTSHDAARALGISEGEFRILAKRHEMTAPYNDGMLGIIRDEINSSPTAAVEIAPSTTTTAAPTQTAAGLSPAFGLFCDALETQLIDQLSTEMRSRMPRIKTAVIDNVIPTES
jgi:hypothetical protein